jgi:hypothetical protein
MAKSKPVVLLSILLLLISMYAVNLPKASACSCAEPPTIAESLELKTAIFAASDEHFDRRLFGFFHPARIRVR